MAFKTRESLVEELRRYPPRTDRKGALIGGTEVVQAPCGLDVLIAAGTAIHASPKLRREEADQVTFTLRLSDGEEVELECYLYSVGGVWVYDGNVPRKGDETWCLATVKILRAPKLGFCFQEVLGYIVFSVQKRMGRLWVLPRSSCRADIPLPLPQLTFYPRVDLEGRNR